MLLNKKQASQYLNVSIECIDKYKDAGKLSFVKIGDRCLWSQAMLDEFVNACTIPAVNMTTARERQAITAATATAGGVA